MNRFFESIAYLGERDITTYRLCFIESFIVRPFSASEPESKSKS